MPRHVLVINPNSNNNVTAAIDKALDPLRTSDAPSIKCITVKDGPYGIESQQDSDVAAELVTETIRSSDQNVDAFVIACYSDPDYVLRDEFKANVILLGCAGMARYRQDLDGALEVPVIDPTQPATAAAIFSIRLGYNSRLRGGRH